MKRRVLICIVTLICMLTMSVSAEGSFDRNKLEGLNIEEVHIHIPGLTQTYHFLWVSDLHIVIDNEEIAEENHETVAGRQTSWAIRPDGKQAVDWWAEELAEQINSASPDAILFGGDMLDLCSEATVEKLKEGLSKITVPYIYIRADHDSQPYWTILNNEEAKALQDSVCGNDAVFVFNYPEIIILGINNSTFQMSEAAVEQMKEIAAREKPIIVVTHVPYDSVVDRSLDETSRAVWQDRNLSWGKDTYYKPKDVTSQWMEIVYGENSPVVEVLAGHLHFTWDGMINESVHEHVFSQAFSGNIGLITVDGE